MEDNTKFESIKDSDEAIDTAYDDLNSDVVEEVPPTPNTDAKVEKNDDNQTDAKHKKSKAKKVKKDPKDYTPLELKKAKQKKIAIIVVSVILAIAIIVTSITVPIVVMNNDKIFVSKADDFKKTGGLYFVLNNDVTVKGDLSLGAINNIDFNGKTLTVNGKLTITNNGNKDVVLGNIKKHDDLRNGSLNVDSLSIKSAGKVVIGAVVNAKDYKIDASDVKLYNSTNVENTANIKAKTVSIESNFVFPDILKENILNIRDANTVNVNGEVSGSVSISNSNGTSDIITTANINSYISKNVFGDNSTCLVINSEIGGKIDSNDVEVDENGNVTLVNSLINKVKLMESSFVREANNIKTFMMHSYARIPEIMPNTDDISIIRTLERVGYIKINDDTDNIVLEFPQVEGADAYIIKIDSNEPIETSENSMDITEFVRDTNKHTISIQAISKGNSELLLPSPIISIDYKTYTTLDTATNINIVNENGKMTLSFDRVNFADEYRISINGKKFRSKTTSVDVTEYFTKGGSYIVEVIATSKNDNILNSKPAMYQYLHKVPLDAPILTITNTKNEVLLNWTAVPNATYYEVIIVREVPVAMAEENKDTIAPETQDPTTDTQDPNPDTQEPNPDEVTPEPEVPTPPQEPQIVETLVIRTSLNSFKSAILKHGSVINSGDKIMIRAISNNPYYTNVESEIVTYIFNDEI